MGPPEGGGGVLRKMGELWVRAGLWPALPAPPPQKKPRTPLCIATWQREAASLQECVVWLECGDSLTLAETMREACAEWLWKGGSPPRHGPLHGGGHCDSV